MYNNFIAESRKYEFIKLTSNRKDTIKFFVRIAVYIFYAFLWKNYMPLHLLLFYSLKIFTIFETEVRKEKIYYFIFLISMMK